MAFSNYTHGFKAGVTIRGVPVEISHPGQVFWVGNNATRLTNEKTSSDGNDGTFLAPFLTLEGALNDGDVKATRGDVIFVRPGFTLTIGTATALNFDKAGVAIIGLGAGTSRPTITMDTATTVTIPVTAANMSIRNFRIIGNLDNIVAAFTLSAVNFSCEDCEFTDTSAALHFLDLFDTSAVANECDGLYIARNRWISSFVAASANMVVSDEAIRNLTIIDNYVQQASVNTTGALMVQAAATAATGLDIRRNFVLTEATDGSTGVLCSGGTTSASLHRGVITDNQWFTLDVAGSGAVSVATSWSKVLKIRNVFGGFVAAGTQVDYVTDGTARSQTG